MLYSWLLLYLLSIKAQRVFYAVAKEFNQQRPQVNFTYCYNLFIYCNQSFTSKLSYLLLDHNLQYQSMKKCYSTTEAKINHLI